MPRSSTAPRPVCARCANAATMPTTAYSPLTMSAIEVPTRTRRPAAPEAGARPVRVAASSLPPATPGAREAESEAASDAAHPGVASPVPRAASGAPAAGPAAAHVDASAPSRVAAGAGGSGSVPVIDIRPDSAWMIMSYAGRCASGPVAPNPLMAAYTRRELSAARRSGGNPSRASVPGRKFSTSTSARRISSVRAARPASCFRSSTTDRLPQFRLVK